MRRKSAASCDVIATAVGGAAARASAAKGVVATAKVALTKARRVGAISFLLISTRFSTDSARARVVVPGAIA